MYIVLKNTVSVYSLALISHCAVYVFLRLTLFITLILFPLLIFIVSFKCVAYVYYIKLSLCCYCFNVKTHWAAKLTEKIEIIHEKNRNILKNEFSLRFHVMQQSNLFSVLNLFDLKYFQTEIKCVK